MLADAVICTTVALRPIHKPGPQCAYCCTCTSNKKMVLAPKILHSRYKRRDERWIQIGWGGYKETKRQRWSAQEVVHSASSKMNHCQVLWSHCDNEECWGRMMRRTMKWLDWCLMGGFSQARGTALQKVRRCLFNTWAMEAGMRKAQTLRQWMRDEVGPG